MALRDLSPYPSVVQEPSWLHLRLCVALLGAYLGCHDYWTPEVYDSWQRKEAWSGWAPEATFPLHSPGVCPPGPWHSSLLPQEGSMWVCTGLSFWLLKVTLDSFNGVLWLQTNGKGLSCPWSAQDKNITETWSLGCLSFLDGMVTSHPLSESLRAKLLAFQQLVSWLFSGMQLDISSVSSSFFKQTFYLLYRNKVLIKSLQWALQNQEERYSFEGKELPSTPCATDTYTPGYSISTVLPAQDAQAAGLQRYPQNPNSARCFMGWNKETLMF